MSNIVIKIIKNILCVLNFHQYNVKTQKFPCDKRIHFFNEFECKNCGKIIKGVKV